jgi:hypothetical protein
MQRTAIISVLISAAETASVEVGQGSHAVNL